MDNQITKKSKNFTAAYARTSTAIQPTGLDAQVRALRRYCTDRGITDYVIYEDDGISGTKKSRPALNRMMEDVEEGRIGRVVVYSFQGSVALEIKQWNKEKAEGKTTEVLDDEITEELKEKEIPKKEPEEIEDPPVPIPVVRY